MTICSTLRFKWRMRLTILAVQSAGYVALPPEDETVIGYHWSDPWNSVAVQVTRTVDRLGQVSRSNVRLGHVSRSNVRLGQVTCLVSRESDACPSRHAGHARQRNRHRHADTLDTRTDVRYNR